MYVAGLLTLHCILHSLVDYPSPADADYKPISSNEETNIVYRSLLMHLIHTCGYVICLFILNLIAHNRIF